MSRSLEEGRWLSNGEVRVAAGADSNGAELARTVFELGLARTVLVVAHPFRAPRHTIAEVGLIGGGQVPMPDEVSLVPTACSS